MGSLYNERNEKPGGLASSGPIRIQPAMFFAMAQAQVSTPRGGLLVEADVPPEMNIQITDASISIDTNKISGASFTIKNTDSKILLAYSIAFQIYFADRAAPIQLRVTEDGSFLYHYLLQPGESKQSLIRTALTSSTDQLQVNKVVAVPDYVEFADGSIYGLKKEVISADLKASRDVKAGLVKKYVGQLNAGAVPEEVINSLRNDAQNETANKQGSAYRVGLSQLLTFMKLQGLSGLMSKMMIEAR